VDAAAIDRAAATVVHALTRGADVGPAGLTLLSRRYAAAGGADIQAALGPALARAVDRSLAGAPTAAWLACFVEARAISDDPLIADAIASLTARLRATWPAAGTPAATLPGVEACLAASAVLPPSTAHAIVPDAIDELERVIAGGYEPGEGLVSPHGSLIDQIEASSALLSAYAVTGRLPYPMLAEELMQSAHRTSWDGRAGFAGAPLEVGCRAATVLCRLATLHGDAEYREIAPVAHDPHYLDTARRTLAALAPASPGAAEVVPGSHESDETDETDAAGAAVYALALLDFLALRDLQ
jgi:hypothetical protein